MKRLKGISGVLWIGFPAMLLSGGAMAALTTYFGVDSVPQSEVDPNGDPFKQRQSFLDQLVKSQSDGLNSASIDQGSTSFKALNGATVDFLSTGDNKNKLTNVGCDFGVCSGRFNTTFDLAGKPDGGPWWETKDDFALTFKDAVSAFGFYATDYGDFGANVSLNLFGNDGALLNTVCFYAKKEGVTDGCTLWLPVVPGDNNTIEGSEVPNGNLLFFGFTDTELLVKSIRFNIGQGETSPPDYIGFDDFVTGPLKSAEPPVNVPEPASLALVAASLLALAATRRRRQR